MIQTMKIDRHVKPIKLECFLNLSDLFPPDISCQNPTNKPMGHFGVYGTYLILTVLQRYPLDSATCSAPADFYHLLLAGTLLPVNCSLALVPNSATHFKRIQMWHSLLKQDENSLGPLCQPAVHQHPLEDAENRLTVYSSRIS